MHASLTTDNVCQPGVCLIRNQYHWNTSRNLKYGADKIFKCIECCS